MLSIIQGKGFHITFENGYKVSVQFGAGNYCDNRNEDYTFNKVYHSEVNSSDAEIAIFKDDKWATQQVWKILYDEELSDDVVGWLEADKIAELLYKVSQL